MPNKKRRLYVGCATLVLLASGCGETGSGKPLTQVAARVDGEEISIHQINALLPHLQTSELAATDPNAMRKMVLDKLIDQQVLYAQAIEKKIDRDPRVVMLVDAAKREIIARAYMDSVVASPPKIVPTDIHQYYVENPALFARRRIYNLEGLVWSADPAQLQAVRHMIEEGKGAQDIAAYLKTKGIEFSRESGVRTAEQIPLDVLPTLSMVEDGDTTLVDSGQRYYVYHVISSQIVPIDEASASPKIATFLANQQGQRMAAQEVKRLKANARIEYLGDFAKPLAAKSGDTVATLKIERSTP